MGTHRPPVVMPDMKRRRASTGERIATIMTLARRLPLTRQVLADQLADATPSQMEFMESWMNAEIESRERSKRSRLLKAPDSPPTRSSAATTGPRSASPSTTARADHDPRLHRRPRRPRPVRPSRHRQDPPRHRARQERMPQGHTRTLLHRRRPGHAAPQAQSDNRLDRELAAIGRTPLLVIDELGYVPIDEDGSRLLFQVVTNAYETQSIIYTTNIEFSGWGRIFGDPNMAAAIIDRTVHHGRMIRFEGESWRKTHASCNNQCNNQQPAGPANAETA